MTLKNNIANLVKIICYLRKNQTATLNLKIVSKVIKNKKMTTHNKYHLTWIKKI